MKKIMIMMLMMVCVASQVEAKMLFSGKGINGYVKVSTGIGLKKGLYFKCRGYAGYTSLFVDLDHLQSFVAALDTQSIDHHAVYAVGDSSSRQRMFCWATGEAYIWSVKNNKAASAALKEKEHNQLIKAIRDYVAANTKKK